MEPIKQIRSRTVVLSNDDIDTDQIIPARFLTTTTKEGLGKHLFTDWRYDKDGRERPEFALNRPDSRGAAVLVGGNNFGCGSSREHAPWAGRNGPTSPFSIAPSKACWPFAKRWACSPTCGP